MKKRGGITHVGEKLPDVFGETTVEHFHAGGVPKSDAEMKKTGRMRMCERLTGIYTMRDCRESQVH